MKALVGALSIAAALAACSATPDRGTAKEDVCSASQKAATDRVLGVVAANETCASDADCSTVNVNAACFDVCTRSVNQVGKGAVDRVITLVEAGECKGFTAAKCSLIPPPCAPPRPSRCVSGKCE